MVSPAVGTVNRVQCIFKIQKKRGVPRWTLAAVEVYVWLTYFQFSSEVTSYSTLDFIYFITPFTLSCVTWYCESARRYVPPFPASGWGTDSKL